MFQRSIPQGTIDDLEKFFPTGPHLYDPGRTATMCFAGERDESLRCQIPAADKEGGTLFFGNRELLVRFSSIPTFNQSAFLQAVRAAMKAQEVTKIHLNIRWTRTSSRLVEFNESTDGMFLEINFL